MGLLLHHLGPELHEHDEGTRAAAQTLIHEHQGLLLRTVDTEFLKLR